MGRATSRTWVWHFDRPPGEIWPVMADTARFNEAAALPKHEIEEIPQADGSVTFLGRLKRGPFALHWREKPVNWVHEQWFEHCREFQNGPFRSLCATFELSAEGAGSRGVYTLAVEVANLAGHAILAGGFLSSAGRTFGRLAADANRFAAGLRIDPFAHAVPAVSAATARRVEAIVAAIEATPHGHGLARRLADFLFKAQEVDLWQIRPLKLARDWGVDPRLTIELCLQAVRNGLLDLHWDLLCPRCRVAKFSTVALDRLPTGAHCSTCNIDYGRDFSRNVEASFRPAPSLRPISGGQYCLFGPMSTPHIKVHVTLEPGQFRELPAKLLPGDYRLRTLEPGPEASITWESGGFPELVADADRMETGVPAPAGVLRLVNRSRRPLTLIVEERSWVRDALTADRVTTLQAFRDLFAGETLRPGDDVGIGDITLMFTDLKGSTAFYERVGDAGAYRLVREHFAFLAARVREHDGAIVKTIGDAVMAAFADPGNAVAAALSIQDKITRFNAGHGGEAIVIKLGLHKGPCIAVTLNERLDYFGSTVNLAARLQMQSIGGDIVLSTDLADDPAVAPVLRGRTLRAEIAAVKGFEHPVSFVRIIGPGTPDH
jgi:class 3 adenylate cyclase